MYRYLFSPIRINNLEIKNRIAYPSLGLLYSYDRKLNERYYEYFRARAAGGAGIVTVGPAGIDFIGSGLAVLSLDDDDAIPSFRKLTGIIKKEGASPWIQLFHAGGYSHPILIDNQTPMAPSPIYSRYSKTTPREMTMEDIETVREAFVQGALRAREAGFDGVEIIGSAGYLLTQFLSPLKNQRTDNYGGSFENRVRFPREVIEQTRRALGPDYPLGIRMAGNDFVIGSNTDSETPQIAKVYEAAGVDCINVTGGWHESKIPQLPMELPRSAYAYLAMCIKNVVSVPIMASNRISDPETAEAVLRDGYADMVNLGRVLIADPEWPIKAFEGRAHEIRPCVACSQGCTDRIFSGQPVCCVGNPQAGFEAERQLKMVKNPKKVMVVGAGPAGLEAAVTAAKTGHKVTLVEKDRDIGGQLWLAGAPPHKKELLGFVRYYRAMVDRYKVRLVLNKTADREWIESEKPDHVIVAEGAKPLVPPIPGVEGPKVLSAWEVLRDNPLLGKRVAVVGGGSVGLETAFLVAAKGTITPEILHFLMTYEAEKPERIREIMFRGTSRVTVFEMLPKVGMDMGKSTKWVLLGNLERYGVTLMTGTRITGIDDGRLSWDKDGAAESADFDAIILAAGSTPVTGVSALVAEMETPHTIIGDGNKIGKLEDAFHGGFLAASNIL